MTLLSDISTIIDADALQIPFESLHHIYGPLRLDHFDKAAHHKRFSDLGMTHYPPFVPKDWIVIDTAILDVNQHIHRTDRQDYENANQLVDSLKKGHFGYQMVYHSESLLVFRRRALSVRPD